MERRVTLKRHKGSSTEKSEASIASQVNSNSTTIVQSDMDKKSPLTVTAKDEVEPGKDTLEILNSRKQVYKRNSQEGDSSKRRRVSTGSGTLKSVSSCNKKKRTTSLCSDKNTKNSGVMSEISYGETDKKVKEILKLKTDSTYYTIIGESDSCWSTGEVENFKEEEQVQVPTWREKPVAPCYVMEGTENLGDDVFSKRHQRLEIDERRRKRLVGTIAIFFNRRQ